jgi:hypothetical protein
MLDLTRMADLGEMIAGYDDECGGQQLHLLDHVKATPLPDGDVLSLEHQVVPLFSMFYRIRSFYVLYIRFSAKRAVLM